MSKARQHLIGRSPPSDARGSASVGGRETSCLTWRACTRDAAKLSVHRGFPGWLRPGFRSQLRDTASRRALVLNVPPVSHEEIHVPVASGSSGRARMVRRSFARGPAHHRGSKHQFPPPAAERHSAQRQPFLKHRAEAVLLQSSGLPQQRPMGISHHALGLVPELPARGLGIDVD